jgi:alpha-amylase/alpha-mannosidase (GH57 family)
VGVIFVVHGHFYQPPRENPWTEEVAREPSAAPAHDWNERITAECYRPNGVARVVDERNRVLALVDNYRLLSFNVGPTLTSWLQTHAPDVLERVVAAGAGALAQAYGHLILPLATERDVRTQVRWGLADVRHRFGHEARGMWLPECAVSEEVLAVLAEEGVAFTILAPHQIAAVRRLDGNGGWVDVTHAPEVHRPFRWQHPTRPELSLDLVVYDGGLSNDVAFGLGRMGSADLVGRAASADEGMVVVATDGETFGHHHRWGERGIAYALAVEAPRQGVTSATVDRALATVRPAFQARVRTSAWSCAHGVGRWEEDCGCSTGGQPGDDQRWRGPLRAALDLLRSSLLEVVERRGPALLRDPWAARDAYIDVVLGATSREAFAAEHVVGDAVDAFSLLEALRSAMAMYTSCGWFFNDLAGLETVQVLRYAARVHDLLEELGEAPPTTEILDVLRIASSNRPEEGDGAQVWRSHVEPARVGPARVAAHLALASVLAGQAPPGRLAAWDIEASSHGRHERGSVALATGVARVRDRRTGRTTAHAYAALRLGGLEVLGATRPADPDRDRGDLKALRGAFLNGAPITALLRDLGERFGPGEFGIDAALPGSAEDLLGDVASRLVDRFVAEVAHLLDEARPTLEALVAAGYPLPPELARPAEVALAARIEALVGASRGSTDIEDHEEAIALARSPLAATIAVDTPAARALLGEVVDGAVGKAVAGEPGGAGFALGAIRLAADLGVGVDLDRAQEAVYAALVANARPDLEPLGEALGLAVDALGLPT